jgi:cytochrome c biogenesis protein ResB
LRRQRFYKPFSLHLVEFKFDRYPGTDIPKNFSSRVRLQRPQTGEDRELLIYMNNPLRYAGETFYQADWDHEDEKGTVLQVVRNPSWLTPYLACALVGGGLVVQFMIHLVGFAMKRKVA